MSKPGGAGGVLILLGCIILLLQWVLARAFSAAVDSSGSSCGVEPCGARVARGRGVASLPAIAAAAGQRPTETEKKKKKELN